MVALRFCLLALLSKANPGASEQKSVQALQLAEERWFELINIFINQGKHRVEMDDFAIRTLETNVSTLLKEFASLEKELDSIYVAGDHKDLVHDSKEFNELLSHLTDLHDMAESKNTYHGEHVKTLAGISNLVKDSSKTLQQHANILDTKVDTWDKRPDMITNTHAKLVTGVVYMVAFVFIGMSLIFCCMLLKMRAWKNKRHVL